MYPLILYLFSFQLPDLQRLELHDVLGVTDDCIIKVVEHCKQLDTLNLSLCTRITDRSVDYIARHASCLRALYLASCDLTDKGKPDRQTDRHDLMIGRTYASTQGRTHTHTHTPRPLTDIQKHKHAIYARIRTSVSAYTRSHKRELVRALAKTQTQH